MSKELIQANRIHNILMSELVSKKDIQGKVGIIELIVKWNVGMHAGRFTCQQLENEISSLGSSVNFKPSGSKLENSILHIGTAFYETGGHTRLFEKYIQQFHQFQHDLVLTEQNEQSLPKRITKLVSNKVIGFKSIYQHRNHVEKALQLAEIAEQYDHVFLHIHQYDIIPLIANGIHKFKKVIFVNHADHTFWVGATMTDLALNIRPFAEKVCLDRRNIPGNLVLPIPVDAHQRSTDDKFCARKRLNINENTIVFLTISSAYKLVPFGKHNFLATIEKLVEVNVNYEIFIIGIPIDSRDKIGVLKEHPRIHILEPMEDLLDFQLAADIYLEGFPYNSLTALLESISLGCCPLLMYNPQIPNGNMETELALNGILTHAVTESEYLNNATLLAKNSALRTEIVEQLLVSVKYYNGGKYWEENISKIFESNYTQKIENNEEFQITENDVKLNQFNLNRLNNEVGNLIEFLLGLKSIQKVSFKNKIKLLIQAYSYQRGRLRLARFTMFSVRVIFNLK